MKKQYGIFSIIILVISVSIIGTFFWAQNSEHEIGEQQLHADVYPLYVGAQWGDEYEKLFTEIRGDEIASIPIKNITDLSAVFVPFDAYYKDKLSALGWIEDQSLAAGGPGSSLTAYKKGDHYIMVGYSTVFRGGAKNEPVQCPCDITFTVFSGRK